MLRVTIEILPSGQGKKARVLSVAHIWNKGCSKRGFIYGIRLGQESPAIDHQQQAYDAANRTGELRDYPRWSASIWDLVARGIQRTLRTQTAQQSLGPLPQSIADVVPVYQNDDIRYVRLQDMPDFVQSHFEAFLANQTVPIIESEGACAYVWDWHRFLGV